MCDHRMLRTCRNEVAVVTTCEVPLGWHITHQATIRAAKWLFPGAWHAGTAVLLLSLTDSRISRCFDHNVSPKPFSMKPMGSFAYWPQGLSLSCSKTETMVWRSLFVSPASHIFRSAGFAFLRNRTKS